MKLRLETLLVLLVCSVTAILLYLLQKSEYIYPIIVFLTILATVFQLSGFSLRDVFRRRRIMPSGPEIIVERK